MSNRDQNFFILAAIIALVLATYVGFAFGHMVGESDGKKPVPRGIEHHGKHKEMKAVMRGIKLVTCGECGIIYDPAIAGVAISEEHWERLWRWTDK